MVDRSVSSAEERLANEIPSQEVRAVINGYAYAVAESQLHIPHQINKILDEYGTQLAQIDLEGNDARRAAWRILGHESVKTKSDLQKRREQEELEAE